MQYSVYDPGRRVYDYYEDGRTDANYPVPRHLNGRGADGVASGAAGWPLPTGARKVGTGSVARGMIASLGGDDGAGPNWLTALGLAIAGYALWKLWRPRHR